MSIPLDSNINENYHRTFPLPSEIFPDISEDTLMGKAFKEACFISHAPFPMVYLALLNSISLASQGCIDVKTPYNQICPVSIQGLVIAESGERKSSVSNLFTKGSKRFQKEDKENFSIQLAEYKLRYALHKKQTARIKKSVDLDDEVQCDEMIFTLTKHNKKMPVKPKLKLLIFEDSTIEALFNGLNENIPNAFFGSSEGGVLLNSRAMLQTAYMNATWSGDNVTVNRKTTASFTIEGARLTILIMTQRCALARFINKTNNDIRGNGFVSRFLICEPLSNCGFRTVNGLTYTDIDLQKFNDRTYELLSESAKRSDYTKKKY